MSEWEPATEAEGAMRDALRASDQEQYFRILARTDIMLPISPDVALTGDGGGWGTWTTEGRTHVLAFTSPEALRECLAGHPGTHRRVPFRDLAGIWPNVEWWLAVNPGLPIEGYLPSWFVTQITRGDVRLPGRTLGARARIEQATGAKARATAQVPLRTVPNQPAPTPIERHRMRAESAPQASGPPADAAPPGPFGAGPGSPSGQPAGSPSGPPSGPLSGPSSGSGAGQGRGSGTGSGTPSGSGPGSGPGARPRSGPGVRQGFDPAGAPPPGPPKRDIPPPDVAPPGAFLPTRADRPINYERTTGAAGYERPADFRRTRPATPPAAAPRPATPPAAAAPPAVPAPPGRSGLFDDSDRSSLNAQGERELFGETQQERPARSPGWSPGADTRPAAPGRAEGLPARPSGLPARPSGLPMRPTSPAPGGAGRSDGPPMRPTSPAPGGSGLPSQPDGLPSRPDAGLPMRPNSPAPGSSGRPDTRPAPPASGASGPPMRPGAAEAGGLPSSAAGEGAERARDERRYWPRREPTRNLGEIFTEHADPVIPAAWQPPPDLPASTAPPLPTRQAGGRTESDAPAAFRPGEGGGLPSRPGLVDPGTLPSRPGSGDQGGLPSRPRAAGSGALPSRPGMADPGALPSRPGVAEPGGLPSRPGSVEQGALPFRPGAGEAGALPIRPGAADPGALRPEPSRPAEESPRPGAGAQPGGFLQSGSGGSRSGQGRAADPAAFRGDDESRPGAGHESQPGTGQSGARGDEPDGFLSGGLPSRAGESGSSWLDDSDPVSRGEVVEGQSWRMRAEPPLPFDRPVFDRPGFSRLDIEHPEIDEPQGDPPVNEPSSLFGPVAGRAKAAGFGRLPGLDDHPFFADSVDAGPSELDGPARSPSGSGERDRAPWGPSAFEQGGRPAERDFAGRDPAPQEPAREEMRRRAEQEAAREAAREFAAHEAARQRTEQESGRDLAAREAAQAPVRETARELAAQEAARALAAQEAARESAAQEAARELAAWDARRQAEKAAAQERADREAARQRADREAAQERTDREAAQERVDREAAQERTDREVAQERADRQAARNQAEREAAQERAELAARERAAEQQAEEARAAAEARAAEAWAIEERAAEARAAEQERVAAQDAQERAAQDAEQAALDAERAAGDRAELERDRAAFDRAAEQRAALSWLAQEQEPGMSAGQPWQPAEPGLDLAAELRAIEERAAQAQAAEEVAARELAEQLRAIEERVARPGEASSRAKAWGGEQPTFGRSVGSEPEGADATAAEHGGFEADGTRDSEATQAVGARTGEPSADVKSFFEETVQKPEVAQPQFVPVKSAAAQARDFQPANTVEQDLLEAVQANSTDRFLSTLLLAKILVPEWSGEGPINPAAWRTEHMNGLPHLVVFTSAERMADRLGPEAQGSWIKFTRLIRNWPPGDQLAFAVNPDSPVGAVLPGTEVVQLATWAAELGLGVDEPVEAPAAAQPVPRPIFEPHVSSGPLLMQKPISPEQLSYYLERGYDRVSGFVHRAGEVAHLQTPEQLYQALGLGYAGSSFKPDADESYVLRWKAYRGDLYRIPYGGPHEAAMRAMEGWVIERPPFRGNGFAPSETSDVIAEFKVDSARLPHHAELWRLRRDGQQELIARLDADGPAWRKGKEL